MISETTNSDRNIEVVENIAKLLRISATELSKRGLHLAAKWSCEQLIGIRVADDEHHANYDHSNDSIASGLVCKNQIESDMTLFAQALVTQGEYQRCAHLMRKNSNNIKTNLSLFISSYALYMAGEKLKSQQKLESNNHPIKSLSSISNDKSIDSGASYGKVLVVPKNPFLKDLFDELKPHFNQFYQQIHISQQLSINSNNKVYTNNKTQNDFSTKISLAMDGYHVFLFAVVVRDLVRQGGGSADMIDLALKNTLLSCGHFTTANTNDDYTKIQTYLRSQCKSILNDTDTTEISFPSVYTLFLYSLHLNPWNW